jgi:hypothetical protein
VMWSWHSGTQFLMFRAISSDGGVAMLDSVQVLNWEREEEPRRGH